MLSDVRLTLSALTFPGLKKKKQLRNLMSGKIEQIELMLLVKTVVIDVSVKFCVKFFMGLSIHQ